MKKCIFLKKDKIKKIKKNDYKRGQCNRQDKEADDSGNGSEWLQ